MSDLREELAALDKVKDALDDTEHCIEQGVPVGDDNAFVLAVALRSALSKIKALEAKVEELKAQAAECCGGALVERTEAAETKLAAALAREKSWEAKLAEVLAALEAMRKAFTHDWDCRRGNDGGIDASCNRCVYDAEARAAAQEKPK